MHPVLVHDDVGERRPQLMAELTGAELQRWYWLATELAGLARELGVSPSGSKQQLTARLVAVLDGNTPGQPADQPPRRDRGRGRQLTGELNLHSVIPRGQRCSQVLRRFFTAQVGPSFRFDGPMREFVATGAGRTLGEAVEHWHATRGRAPGDIAPQFELNRFLRDWHAAHPDGNRGEAFVAWRLHRSLPVEARPSNERSDGP